jgi:hypothetical protein
MTFWDFCDHHIVLTAIVAFVGLTVLYVLVSNFFVAWHNIRRNDAISRISEAKTKGDHDG